MKTQLEIGDKVKITNGFGQSFISTVLRVTATKAIGNCPTNSTWFPESGLKWVRVDGILDIEGRTGLYSIFKTLREFYGAEYNNDLIYALFIGRSLQLKNGLVIPSIKESSPLSIVKKRWDRIIKEIENNNIEI